MIPVANIHTPYISYALPTGLQVEVKREDLCCPYPGPSFSKVRGVQTHLSHIFSNPFCAYTHVGVMDSRHSKAGWGVSWICKKMGISTRVYYPVFKDEAPGFVRPFQQEAKKNGASIIPLRGNLMSAVLWNIARKQTALAGGYMLPNGLKLKESAQGTCDELCATTPEGYLCKDWVVSASSGTLAAGVVMGLATYGPKFTGTLYIHMGYSRSVDQLRRYIISLGGDSNFMATRVQFVDEGYKYSDQVETDCPWPSNPYYDAKAYKWVLNHSKQFCARGIVIWNIGD